MRLATDDFDEVYQPAEDTYLLLEVALEEVGPGDEVIEIGCGRSLVSRSLLPLAKKVVATDINPHALRLVRGYSIDVLRADLFRGIKARFDLVVFNPPYLPTKPEERTDGWLNMALDGGKSGRVVINRFLEELPDHLKPGGRCLLLVSTLTGVDEVVRKAKSSGLEARVVATKRFFFEGLHVIRLNHGEHSKSVSSTFLRDP